MYSGEGRPISYWSADRGGRKNAGREWRADNETDAARCAAAILCAKLLDPTV